MTPSWYDVLDVEPTASSEEVRTAWRAGVADLDPTDRRFRLLNQAAEVLLDPARRAEHDAALAAEAADLAPEPEPEPDPVPGTPSDADVLAAPPASAPTPAATPTTAEPEPAAGVRWVPPAWVLAGLAVLVAVLLGASVLVARTPTDSSVSAGTRTAQSVAEEAAVAVLSYDYRDMDASRTAASSYLTSSFRRDYDALFAQIEANAESVKPVVTAEAVASGIERVSRTGDRVSVLVFLDRPTLNASTTTPVVYQDYVTMQMQRVDGEWLVDDLESAPAAQ